MFYSSVMEVKLVIIVSYQTSHILFMYILLGTGKSEILNKWCDSNLILSKSKFLVVLSIFS